MGVMVSARYAEWRPGRVVARCVGFGAGLGALIGFLVVLTLCVLASAESGNPQVLDGLGFAAPFALVIGAVLGAGCGLVACVPLLLAGESERSSGVSLAGRPVLRVRPARGSLAAGAGGAMLPAIFAVIAASSHSRYWELAWWGVGTVALAAGLALGPYVLYGPAAFGGSSRPGAGTQI
jgi:hypothetical protein